MERVLWVNAVENYFYRRRQKYLGIRHGVRQITDPAVANNGRVTRDRINTLLKGLEKEKQTEDCVASGGFRRRRRRTLPTFAVLAAAATTTAETRATAVASPRLS